MSGRSDSDPLLSDLEARSQRKRAANGLHKHGTENACESTATSDGQSSSNTAASILAGSNTAAAPNSAKCIMPNEFDTLQARDQNNASSSSSRRSSAEGVHRKSLTVAVEEAWHRPAASATAPEDIPDVAEAAAAAHALAKESPESPKAVPLGVPIGRRVWCDRGIDLSSRQNPLMEGFALITMAIYLGFIHLLLLLFIGSFYSSTCMYTLLGIIALHMLPARPLLWESFLTNPVWKAWRRYFRFSVIMDKNFELAGKKYVIAEYPHGAFPFSQMIAVSLTDAWPGHKIYCIAADAVFHVPLWRHVMTWIGAKPATAENFRNLLKKGSVGLVPGGIAEMFMVEEDREVIKLRDRKGFVRIAVEMGADLLPCYHYGNTQLFGWGPKSLEPLARRHRVALGFLKGRWGLPFALPQRVPLMMVVGGPIKVKQTHPSEPGFAAVVDDAHAKLIDAMQELYDKYKAEYGWADRPLIIL